MTNDILIVGGGHNGLVCAFYLAARGLKVKVVEKRTAVGAAAVTEEFRPGFRNLAAAGPAAPAIYPYTDYLPPDDHAASLRPQPVG